MKEIRCRTTGKPMGDLEDSCEWEDDRPTRRKKRNKKSETSKKSAARDTSDEASTGTV